MIMFFIQFYTVFSLLLAQIFYLTYEHEEGWPVISYCCAVLNWFSLMKCTLRCFHLLSPWKLFYHSNLLHEFFVSSVLVVFSL